MFFYGHTGDAVLMRRELTLCTFLLATTMAAACSSNPVTTPSNEPAPTVIAEVFSGTVTVNGARTHPFSVDRAGTVSARLTTLSDPAARVGLSLGTWNGVSCAIIIANDDAPVGTSTLGTAQATGQFCVRIYDVGLLTAAVDYVIDVSHF